MGGWKYGGGGSALKAPFRSHLASSARKSSHQFRRHCRFGLVAFYSKLESDGDGQTLTSP